MFAVVSYNGNQYKLTPGTECEIDLVDEAGKELSFNDVLLIADGEKTLVGAPTIKNASVQAEVIGRVHGEKVRVFKFRAKKRYKRDLGHRQDFTKIKVLAIKQDEK